ncbi:hypothetical protein Ddc_11259 [Ditylenchus destructor]|nr:hypothetical protein Ddc_11259 [Ditylenchus destructor]
MFFVIFLALLTVVSAFPGNFSSKLISDDLKDQTNLLLADILKDKVSTKAVYLAQGLLDTIKVARILELSSDLAREYEFLVYYSSYVGLSSPVGNDENDRLKLVANVVSFVLKEASFYSPLGDNQSIDPAVINRINAWIASPNSTATNTTNPLITKDDGEIKEHTVNVALAANGKDTINGRTTWFGKAEPNVHKRLNCQMWKLSQRYAKELNKTVMLVPMIVLNYVRFVVPLLEVEDGLLSCPVVLVLQATNDDIITDKYC